MPVPKYKYKQSAARSHNKAKPTGGAGLRIGRPNYTQGEIKRTPIAPDYVPASPGIDGVHNFGGLNSGASTTGFPALDSINRAPYDWKSTAPQWSRDAADQVGGSGSIFPTAKNANEIRNRKRGISPWGGFYGTVSGQSGRVQHESGSGGKADSVLKPGGTADLNPGADGSIAGGHLGSMQASTLVRLHGVRADRNMRLPVTPDAAQRSGNVMRPAGGGADASPSAPLAPQLPGMPSIFGTFTAGSKQPIANAAHTPGCGKGGYGG